MHKLSGAGLLTSSITRYIAAYWQSKNLQYPTSARGQANYTLSDPTMHLTGDLSFQRHSAVNPNSSPTGSPYLWGGEGEHKAGLPGRASGFAGRQRRQLCLLSFAGTVFRSSLLKPGSVSGYAIRFPVKPSKSRCNPGRACESLRPHRMRCLPAGLAQAKASRGPRSQRGRRSGT